MIASCALLWVFPALVLIASAENEACTDDLKWTDENGIDCTVYAYGIKNGQFSREKVCDYQDGLAKKHCPLTCNVCDETAATACKDDAKWKDEHGETCAVYSFGINSGKIARDTACSYNGGAAEKHCPLTCHACHTGAEASSPKKAPSKVHSKAPSTHEPEASTLPPKGTCYDSPTWTDENGDGCPVFKKTMKALKSNDIPTTMVCDAAAKKHCPITCNSCPPKSLVPDDAPLDLMLPFKAELEVRNVISIPAVALISIIITGVVTFTIHCSRFRISTMVKKPHAQALLSTHS